MFKLIWLFLQLIIFRGQMGNAEFQVPNHVTNQWFEVCRGNKKYLRNKITLEQFEFMVLEKLAESLDISLLIERSIYSIPKTPKVIILNDQKAQLFILVQQSDQSLAQHLSKVFLTVDILELLSQTFSVIHCLVKKYGAFGITEDMIGLNKNLQILAWISQNKQKNQVQIPIESKENPQRAMIAQILSIFKKYSRVLFYQEELNGHKDFQSVQSQITKMIKKRKIEMAANFTEIKSKGEGFRRALSPQTSFGSFRHNQIKSPKAVEGSTKLSKRTNIPNFLKRVADKKVNFLDSLNHKRTVTIDDTQKQALSKQKKIQNLRNQNREKCSSKSMNKVKSLKVVETTKDKNSIFSGEISKMSYPTSTYTEKTFDLLTQSGCSSNNMIKKREFRDKKTVDNTKKWKFQSFTLKNGKDSSLCSPTFTENHSNYWQINGQSCLFQSPQNSKPQPNMQSQTLLAFNVKIPLLAMCNNTTVSNYFNETKQKEPIIEEESQSVSKTLQDEFNDFFSNHSKSPRFMLQAMPQSNELTEQFSKIIDF